MNRTLEKRLLLLRRHVEGVREKNEFAYTHRITVEELNRITPPNAWHNRILSELDFCLQMKTYAGMDVTDEVDRALTVLEEAHATDGVLTDAACERAEQCLMPLAEEAHTYILLLVGHAHLDMNWMWGYDETVATVIATTQTMLKLMEEYPEFCFSQSQASVYQILEEHASDLMPEIQKRIREGRWEVTASSWVETDKNMPCNESLQNHILYTKKYLKEHWDIDSATLDIDFSPDTFGHSAFLPELDALGGVRYYYHCRGLGDADKVLYRWQAPSGKELLMYKEPYWYDSGITPQPAIGLPRVATMSGGLRTGMAVYGCGDHGGGPTRRDLNCALEMQKWPVFPRLRFARFHDYFAEAETVREKLPVVTKELNPVFTGCYSTQSRIKKGNRRAESALLGAEKLSALLAFEQKGTYDERAFEKAWQNVLFTHFHDILTGSCVQNSREHAMGLYQEAMATANSKAARALERLAADIDTSELKEEDDVFSRSEGAGVGWGVRSGNIPAHVTGTGMTRIYHIVNTTGVEREENARLTVWDWPGNVKYMGFRDAKGQKLPSQRISDLRGYWEHYYFEVLVTVKVPAYGYTTVVLCEEDPYEVTDCYLHSTVSERQHFPDEDVVLENQYLSARFDSRTGEMYSLIDKISGKERLRQGESGGLRYIQAEKDNMTSWNIGRWIGMEKIGNLTKMSVTGGELTKTLHMEQSVASSQIITNISLGSEDKFLKVELSVDWKEESKSREVKPILAYGLPLAESTGDMLCDVPGGALWRREQELDLPCLRYGAAKFTDGRVLALVSDCKYGFRLSRGDLFVTLIHTAKNPDPYPERGVHEIALYILPSEANATVLAKETDVCLHPLQHVTNSAHAGSRPTTGSLLSTEGKSAVFTGVALRDGCLAVRMYESAGESCPVTITLRKDVRDSYCTDLLGNKLDVPVTCDGNQVSMTLQPYMQAELRMR